METYPSTPASVAEHQPDTPETPKQGPAAATAAAEQRITYLLAENVLGQITSDELSKELRALLPTVKVASPLEQFQTPEEKKAAAEAKPWTAPTSRQATAPGSMPPETTSTQTGPPQHVAGSGSAYPAGGDPQGQPAKPW